MKADRVVSPVATLATLALAILTQLSCASAPVDDAVADRQRAVEESLLPAVVVAGDSAPLYSLAARMEHYKVPGMSVAVINDGKVEWAKGYGVKEVGSSDFVTASTRFQAASISKPVAATAALRLVEEGRLKLEANVNDELKSWRVPDNEFTAKQPVTLREILSHTAGLTVHGFPGYAAGEKMPSTVEVLDGKGNTDPVRVDTVPGTIWRYSGGGYTVAQLLVHDVTGEPFADVMKRLVLDPLGMKQSTYEQPLPERLADSAAVAYRSSGKEVEGRWHTYPEQAAAGLWTTPSDLARFALGIRAAYMGEEGAVLKQATAREMLTERMGGYGLGVAVEGAGDSLRFSHGGANEGYRAFFVLHPSTGDGVAIMTNSDAGAALYMEVVRAVARVYDWPDFRPETRTVVQAAPGVIEPYAGDYVLDKDFVITITRDGGQLFASYPGQPKTRLLAESETQFFPEGNALRLTFERDGKGRVTHLVVHTGGQELKAKRRG
ncbi:MAG TPA: serine hydrolase [Gemmatimonadaceae bacterium]|nr:serine hydrolase [Gemmatimonadaceae bacterium]